MPRYLVVRIDDSNPNNFSKVRKAIHEVSKENGIDLADFGADFTLVRESETMRIITIFENVMARAKERQKEIDSTPRPKRIPNDPSI